MKQLFYKIKYFGGSIYRGLIGMYQNAFDKAPEIKTAVEWFVLGNSREGRNIRCYKIGTGPKKILLVAGIHGNEVGTVKLAQNLINWFYPRREKFFNLTVFVVPCLNPDGLEVAIKFPDYFGRGRMGRFNANNVDLNRNFPATNFEQYSVWMSGKNYTELTEVYCGEAGGSEPEARALVNLIEGEKIGNIIGLHNVGGDVLVKNGEKTATEWAKIYNQKAKFRIRNSVNLSGSLSDWCAEKKINYMTVEGTTRWGSDWKKQKVALEEILKDLQNN